MADIKSTDSLHEPTRQQFPEVKGKIIESVEIIADTGYYEIDISFQDKTGLAFSLEPCVTAFPQYSDWTGGEEKPIKEYPPLHSRGLRSE